MANTKLELTWLDKDKPFKVEPRLLIENPKLSNIDNTSDENNDNLLIHGDNLIALKSLESKYAGKIKCIYIDPPYNTGNAFEKYDDNQEHSTWLSLMRQRLLILRKLLSNDGVIVIQIDDNEQAYLKVLCDEVFGRNNFVNNICVKMSDLSGPKMAHVNKRFPKIKEYLLIYKKENIDINVQTEEKKEWDKEYKNFLDISKDDLSRLLSLTNSDDIAFENNTIVNKLIPLSEALLKYGVSNNEKDKLNFCKNNAWRIARTSNASTIRKFVQDETNLNQKIALIRMNEKTMFVKTDFDRKAIEPRVQYVFANDTINVPLGDLWLNINTSFNSEGGVTLKNGQKPEALIKIVISAFTNTNDLVLDSFLGSGTTAAVAHKMKRRWIGIEMGNQAYSLAKVRMDNVIGGRDFSGITNEVKWGKGGGYRFYELAPTMIKIDSFGQAVINPEYNSDMLAAAVALHEGYTYEPDQTLFWKQAKNGESSFLFTTTRHLSRDFIDSIVSQMSENDFLVISCKSFDSVVANLHKNIAIKKIPQSLLKNCEFDKDNYNLNIINPPVYDGEEDDE